MKNISPNRQPNYFYNSLRLAKTSLVYSRNRQVLIALMERKLGVIVNWLLNSGMKVNEQKTDLSLFYKRDTTPITITLNGQLVNSNKSINVLGV